MECKLLTYISDIKENGKKKKKAKVSSSKQQQHVQIFF